MDVESEIKRLGDMLEKIARRQMEVEESFISARNAGEEHRSNMSRVILTIGEDLKRWKGMFFDAIQEWRGKK